MDVKTFLCFFLFTTRFDVLKHFFYFLQRFLLLKALENVIHILQKQEIKIIFVMP